MLRPARGVHVRAAIPVLLDGDDLVQVERGADVEGGEPLLDRQAYARSFREAAVPHRASAVAVENDPGVGGGDLYFAIRGGGCRRRHRAVTVRGCLPGLLVRALCLPR